jgi:hypothetical protein
VSKRKVVDDIVLLHDEDEVFEHKDPGCEILEGIQKLLKESNRKDDLFSSWGFTRDINYVCR